MVWEGHAFIACGKKIVAPASRRLSRGHLALAFHGCGNGTSFRRAANDAISTGALALEVISFAQLFVR
jgi:hypothetical protein